jgi:SAM-dependent methyltransferase
MTDTNEGAFAKIYEQHTWQGLSLSGPGSDPLRTSEFRSLLTQFLKEHRIQSVVDLGCGDWSYAYLVDWGEARYLGIDIVQSVIDKNQNQFATPRISFLCMDAIHQDLPYAELLIIKEVLQHLPISDVHTILAKARTFPFAIFVNDVSHHIRGTWRQLWRWQSICRTNTDIKAGGYRLLALREPPFSLSATQLATYRHEYGRRRLEKEVLLWSRPSE